MTISFNKFSNDFKKYFNTTELLQLITSNFYSILYYNSEIWHLPSLKGNLKGKLLLIHGEIDNNVHPANTLRVVNALIKANKRFDMLILPTQRHGFGDMNEYWFWRTADYFSKYLLGDHTERSVDIDELNRDVERKK